MSAFFRLASVVRDLALAIASFVARGFGGRNVPGGGPRTALAVAVAGAACSLLAVGAAPALADSCSNAAFRQGPSANLPDCRAYEQVSPQDTGGQNVAEGTNNTNSWVFPWVATAGGAIGYLGYYAIYGDPQGAPVDSTYVSTRGADGWTTKNLDPAQDNLGAVNSVFLPQAFSTDLSEFAFWNQDPLTSDATPGGIISNYLGNVATGAYTLQTPNMPSTATTSGAQLDAASSDLSQVIYDSPYPLTPGSGSSDQGVYEVTNGQPTLVSVLPDGTQPNLARGLDGAAGGDPPTAASGQNSVIYWTTGNTLNTGGSLYASTVTPGGTVTSAQVNASSDGTVDPLGAKSALLWGAANGGATAFFTTPQKLTTDATTGPSDGGNDLYSYNAASGDVTDLTVDTNSGDANGADVQGVVGLSQDGSVVYFVAKGVLASGGQAGEDNLYVWDNGTIKYVNTLAGGDSNDWTMPQSARTIQQTVRVTPSGGDLSFTSTAQVTSYDNNGLSEIYRYDLASGTVNCVSCDPGGQAPSVGASFNVMDNTVGNFVQDYTTSNMSTDGSRVFFQDAEQLLPQAASGVQSVYEWEADGSGSCASSAQNGGCLYLISDGQGSNSSYFVDASPDGTDVFFTTADQLTSNDNSQLLTMYDARVDGGFPAPATTPACATSSQCEGSPGAAPPVPSAGSVSFSGPGNELPSTTSSARVKVTKKAVKGSEFTLSVKVSAKGKLTITGADVNKLSRSESKAGTYKLTVKLTAKAKKQLGKKRRLKVVVKVAYKPAGGKSSTATVSVELKA